MKKIMIISLIVLSVFLIYLCNLDRQVYYLSLNGSITDAYHDYSYYVNNYLKEKGVLEIYVNEYSEENLTITDFINAINDNKKVKKADKEITLKNALIKADLVTLSFSSKDILERKDKMSVYDYIDLLTNDFEKLLSLMRQYCKEDIIFVGFYNAFSDNEDLQRIFKYLNQKYKEVCGEYNVDFVDANQLFEGHSDFLNENFYDNDMGENIIASQIINHIDKELLNNK